METGIRMMRIEDEDIEEREFEALRLELLMRHAEARHDGEKLASEYDDPQLPTEFEN